MSRTETLTQRAAEGDQFFEDTFQLETGLLNILGALSERRKLHQHPMKDGK